MMRKEPPPLPSPKWTTSGTRSALVARKARRPSASPSNISRAERRALLTKSRRGAPSGATTASSAKDAHPELPPPCSFSST